MDVPGSVRGCSQELDDLVSKSETDHSKDPVAVERPDNPAAGDLFQSVGHRLDQQHRWSPPPVRFNGEFTTVGTDDQVID